MIVAPSGAAIFFYHSCSSFRGSALERPATEAPPLSCMNCRLRLRLVWPFPREEADPAEPQGIAVQGRALDRGKM